MKKLLIKVRHWIIRKLGGIVNPPVQAQVIHIPTTPVTIQAHVKADALMWYGYGKDDLVNQVYKQHVMDDLKHKLFDAICENEGLVQIAYEDTDILTRDNTGTVDIRAIVRLYKIN